MNINVHTRILGVVLVNLCSCLCLLSVDLDALQHAGINAAGEKDVPPA